MADPKEDRIDFQKLERELEAAVESDAHYWRENDAKMRAMEQRVETYEQFRDMVAASHIKPLDKEDKVQGMLGGQGKQPWNPYCNKTNDGSDKSSADDGNMKQNAAALPSNSNDFTKQWRKLKDHAPRYNYLLDIGGDRLTKIFHAGISFGLLGDILTVLNQCLQPAHMDEVMHTLTCLTKTNRFGLSLDFLSKTEKTQCHELFSKLESYVMSEGSAEDISSVETFDQTDDGGVAKKGHVLNQNSSNSGGTDSKETQDAPAKKQVQGVKQGSDDKKLVSKETLEAIRRIYKVLPLGR